MRLFGFGIFIFGCTCSLDVPSILCKKTTKPISLFQADDNASGIHFTVHDRRMSRNRLGSTNSIQSSAGSVPRVNTVTNMLRRFFSREDSRTPNTPDGKHCIVVSEKYELITFPLFHRITANTNTMPQPIV